MADMSTQLHEGMEVHTSDGSKLGKIAQVWFGASVGSITPGTEESCFEVHRGFLGRETLYIPCSAVANVTNNTVTLNVDASAAGEMPSWHRKPAWISQD
ncbi:MAG: PRC-barrel domain-containing protein [Chloroflexota bacterium]|nr:PRC-barrel domain-containing protein [Chloroflexota bacterium]PLS78215.1 MAG: hypothetical protein CYG59_19675 [Chloroflexota bacterium]